jgi:RND superfamily putative drug exporter
MLVLALADFNATREMGPILALGIAVMIACGLTLLPALLTFTKPVRRERSAGWARIGALVRRRPARLASLSASLLALGALGNLTGTGYLTLPEQYRSEPESVLGQQLIAQRYDPPGRVAPVDVVVDSNVALEVKDALGRVPFVASAETDSEGGPFVSLEVLLKEDPFSLQAMDRIETLRAAARRAAGEHVALVGGVTAQNHDNRDALARDARLIVPLVLALILLVLVVLLRCLVAPLYLIATVILSFAFALGVSSLVFADTDPSLAIFAFIFLVGLGVDDNIFLFSRIREEGDDVIVGLEKTGGVITSAGLILAGTFAALMALELEALFQVGFTVALGLLVDAFVVRTFLVPSIALLLGRWSWWPAFAGRRAKDVALRPADG